MQNQVEEIILLPTTEGKIHRNENEVLRRLQTSSSDYTSNEHRRNLFKR